MREASRLEQAFKSTHFQNVNLNDLLSVAVEGYRSAYPAVVFNLALPKVLLNISADPELISQALDKLISNAVDFHKDNTPVEIQLVSTQETATIKVLNQGPVLPEDMRNELFQSMISLRDKANSQPHLGLGLYLVRLISEFLGGRAEADNQDDGSGVWFGISLPLNDIT